LFAFGITSIHSPLLNIFFVHFVFYSFIHVLIVPLPDET
jgi:hypothetical protein